jgi:hypothetical protein
MAETIESLKKELELYKQNGAVGLYYELNRFINGTVSLMRKQGIESLLTATKDEDPKKFERMMVLIKNAKEHVSDMKEMKSALGITGNEEDDKRNKPFVDGIAQQRP